MGDTSPHAETFDELSARLARVADLNGVTSLLSWDQQTMMPDEGTPARSKQLGTIKGLRHDILGDDEFGVLLAELDGSDLSPDQRAIHREATRAHERTASVPDELVSEIAETTSNAHPIWEEAKKTDDFASFAPTLEEIIELKREYAAEIDPDADPYAVLFADYEPYLPLETAEKVLERVRAAIVPLIDEISVEETQPDLFAGSFDLQLQADLSRDVLDNLGYDWDRGRLDTAAHPFSSGNQFDARVTTRFVESDLLSGLSATIHEFGHAHYELGLPDDAYGTPLGQSRDLTVHESQSRLWENHVGRSEPFWEYLLPRVGEYFPSLADASARDAYVSANQVYPDNLIRVDADELTYHLHIIIRFEIERALIDGSLAVEDIPTVWNDKYESYLGIRPETDSVGCLQDVHWSSGLIGYFPTYSLGSVLAAQLYDAASNDITELDESIRHGEFDELTQWLRDHVHRHGQRYTTPELVEVASGEPYSADAFISYITEKFETLRTT